MKKKNIKTLIIPLLVLALSLNIIYIIVKMRRDKFVVNPRSYQMEIKGDSMDLYDGERKVKTLKIDSLLNKVIVDDN